jgi:hypothetical protein
MGERIMLGPGIVGNSVGRAILLWLVAQMVK